MKVPSSGSSPFLRVYSTRYSPEGGRKQVLKLDNTFVGKSYTSRQWGYECCAFVAEATKH